MAISNALKSVQFLRNAVTALQFGAIGGSSSLDRAGIQAAIDAVSTAGGGTVYLEPGVSYTCACNPTSGPLIVKPNVTLDLRGATLNLQLTGTVSSEGMKGLVIRSHATVMNGTIEAHYVSGAGTQGGFYSAITIGPYYGESPSVGSISPDEGVHDWRIQNMTLSTDVNGKPTIQIQGGAYNGLIENIVIPSGANSGIHLDWGSVGNIQSGGTVQQRYDRCVANKSAFEAGTAYTTHPHNISIRNVKVGSMTGTGTGSFGLRFSGVNSIHVSNYTVEGSTYAGFFHTAGDLGYEFAPVVVKNSRHKEITITNFNVIDANDGWGFFADCFADDVEDAVSLGYVPFLPPLQYSGLVFTNCDTCSDAGSSVLPGWRIQSIKGGTAYNCSASKHQHGVRIDTQVSGFKWIRGRTFSNREHGITFDGGVYAQDVHIEDPVCYLNGSQLSTTAAGINLTACVRPLISGGVFGDEGTESYQSKGIAADSTVSGATIINNYVRSVKSSGIAYAMAGSTDFGVLWLFAGNRAVSGITGYSGAQVIPVATRMAVNGDTPRDFIADRASLSADKTPASGFIAVQGDTIEYSYPVASGGIGSKCTAGGNPGTWSTWGTLSA